MLSYRTALPIHAQPDLSFIDHALAELISGELAALIGIDDL